MRKKKVWEVFRDYLKSMFYGGNLFVTKGRLPETDDEVYWYNKALQDCVMELRNYELLCESKYKSLVSCLSKNGINVYYDEMTNTHMINTIHTTIEL